MISERDMEIYKRKIGGERLQHIADDYKLSRERIRQICRKIDFQKKREELGFIDPPKKVKPEDTDLFEIIEQNPLKRLHVIQRRAYTCLSREYWKRNGLKAGLPTIEFLMDLRYNDIAGMQSAGPQTVEYLMELKDAINDGLEVKHDEDQSEENE